MIAVSESKKEIPDKAGYRETKETLYTSWFWRFIMIVIVHIPTSIFKGVKF